MPIRFNLVPFGILASFALAIGGCANSDGAAPALIPQEAQLQSSHLNSFSGAKVRAIFTFPMSGASGTQPTGPLISLRGSLFGATLGEHYGSIFSLDPVKRLLHRIYIFKGGRDGLGPNGVLALNGMFYGTTGSGGLSKDLTVGRGTVFSIDPKTGSKKTIYLFKGRPGNDDGANPGSGLIALSGVLYGTTLFGGIGHRGDCDRQGCGTVFGVDPATGVERVVYRFKGGEHNDGANPLAALVAVNGTLYGTTSIGGGGTRYQCRPVGASCGYGTVFSVDPKTGTERILARFDDFHGGQTPMNAPLIYLKGFLYGATWFGGKNASCSSGFGCGVVFSINPTSGALRVVYSFLGGRDGEHPNGVTALNGILYGTTLIGGHDGAGTVFAIDPLTGLELFRRKPSTGAGPTAPLTIQNGLMYGTTSFGGSSPCVGRPSGCGTIFSLAP
jgi:uncharacterized repeat protein (TIGR03803 family)